VPHLVSPSGALAKPKLLLNYSATFKKFQSRPPKNGPQKMIYVLVGFFSDFFQAISKTHHMSPHFFRTCPFFKMAAKAKAVAATCCTSWSG